MNNPFENKNETYFVLSNEESQYSVWPSFLEVPSGWKIIYGETGYAPCMEYINTHWLDMW